MSVDQTNINQKKMRTMMRLCDVNNPGVSIHEIDLATLTAIEGIQQAGEPDLLVELIDLYLKDAPTRIDAMKIALERGDSTLLKQAAHTLKGSSANLGIFRVAEACRELEQVDSCNSTQTVDALFLLLENRFAIANLSLAAERQRRIS